MPTPLPMGSDFGVDDRCSQIEGGGLWDGVLGVKYKGRLVALLGEVRYYFWS